MTKTIDREYILERINDWEKRLNELFLNVETWSRESEDTVEVRKGDVPQAREELMLKFDVEPRNLPALAILAKNNKISFVPLGLWVLGANGRVNIKTNKEPYILVDFGGKDGAPSEWILINPISRDKRVPLNKEVMVKLIENMDIFV